VYPFPNPPYILLIAGLLAGLLCGAAFQKMLEQAARDWFQDRSTSIYDSLSGIQLLTPFGGMCAGICVFLASGLEIFGISRGLSYEFAAPLTLLTAVLVWFQLQRVLKQLEKGGSAALELD